MRPLRDVAGFCALPDRQPRALLALFWQREIHVFDTRKLPAHLGIRMDLAVDNPLAFVLIAITAVNAAVADD